MAARKKGSRAEPLDLPAFARSLEVAGPLRGYLWHGKGGSSDYPHRLAIDQLKARYGSEGYEVHYVDKEMPSPASLLAELVSPGLFAEPKLVVFLEATKLVDSQTHLEVFERALKGSGPGTIAVSAVGGRLSAKIDKLFRAYGQVVKTRDPYETPPPWKPGPPENGELPIWVAGRARDRGRLLRPADAWLLIERIGGDLAELDGEVEKLALLAAGKQITRDEVLALVGQHRTHAGFELADALLDRGRARAAELVRKALLIAPSAESVLYSALYALRTGVARLATVRAMADRDGRVPTGRALASTLKVQGFVADKIVARLGRYPDAEEIRALRHALYRADRDYKSGELNDAAWLAERLLVAFCPPRTSRKPRSTPPGPPSTSGRRHR